MTLTLELDLDSVKLNHRVTYRGQRSFRSQVIDWTHRKTRTLTPDRLLYVGH